MTQESDTDDAIKIPKKIGPGASIQLGSSDDGNRTYLAHVEGSMNPGMGFTVENIQLNTQTRSEGEKGHRTSAGVPTHVLDDADWAGLIHELLVGHLRVYLGGESLDMMMSDSVTQKAEGLADSAVKRKRRRPADIDLSVVADLWRDGSIDAVSEHFYCSDRTASRYVARAREEGLIGADERPAS